MKPPAAIVICAHDDEEYIERVVRAAVEQEYDGKEVIVVDDASTDGTSRVLDGIPGITLLRNETNLGLAASLTRGFAATAAPIVFSLHSDCLLRDRQWMAKMVEPFEDPAVGAVVSRRVYPPRTSLPIGARLFEAVIPQRLDPSGQAAIDLDFFRDKADAYRHELIDRLGGWDRELFTAGEDTDLSIKMRAAGYRIVLHPQAAVEYIFSSRQKTIRGGFKKAIQYGQTAVPLYRRHRYDGLQTRSYLWCLMGLLIAALPLIPRLAASAALLLTSFNRTFMFHKLGRRVPLGVFYIVTAGPLLAYGMLTPRSLLPIASFVVPIGSLAFASTISLKNSLRPIRQGERPALLPVIFCYSIIWRFASGLGYLAGWLKWIMRVERIPKSRI